MGQEISIVSEKKIVPAEVAGLSFEAALRELETIVTRLEQGEVDLEDSIALYERGQILKAHCEALLRTAETADPGTARCRWRREHELAGEVGSLVGIGDRQCVDQ